LTKKLITMDSAIMFDMDNTVLGSHIDLQTMRREVVHALDELGFLPENYENMGLAQNIDTARRAGLAEKDVKKVWEIIISLEEAGMVGALAEPGAPDMLEKLRGRSYLALVTNNAATAAHKAIASAGLKPYFDVVVAREDLPELKPLPGSIWFLPRQFPAIKRWAYCGDSWVDAVASKRAGCAFVAYTGSREEDWPAICARWQLEPEAFIGRWDSESAMELLKSTRPIKNVEDKGQA